MNMQSFLKTLKTYGYSSQHTAQVMNTLFKAYTDHTFSKRIPPAKDLALFVAFRFISDEGGSYVFTAKGLTVAEALVAERVHAVSQEMMRPDAFFVLTFMLPHIETSEIRFLITSTSVGETYTKIMDSLQKAGLAYYENGFRAPKNLYTFFEFPFEEEPFQTVVQHIRAYLRLSPLNPRIMRVTFSDMRGCTEEVMQAIKDMRAQGIIKEFVRDKGYSFRVLDAHQYKSYMQTFLDTTLQQLRFVPPSPTHAPPVQCGWDSVGLLDEYPVAGGASMNILLFGDPGPLKQLWAQHYTYGELISGKGCIYVGITSPPDDIRRNFARFSKDIAQFEAENRFVFVDCYPQRQKSQEISAPIDTSSLTDFGMALSEAFQKVESESGVVVFDSLSNFMLYFDPEQVIKFAVSQASKLKEWKWTGIFIVEKGVNDERIENSLKFLLDGVFEIHQNEFLIQWIRGIVDKPVMYALDISKRGLLLLPKR
jgi:KaiC/GvpD/RAD55 family RecA-like ATPase